MPWVDGHLDLAYLALCGRDLCVPCPDPAEGCVTLPELRDAGVEIAFATIFTEPDEAGKDHPCSYPAGDDLDAAEAAGRRQLVTYRQLEGRGEITFVRSRHDLEHDAGGSGLKIVLLMEGADPIRNPEQAPRWFEDGVRIVGMTWAMGTRYAGGNRAPGPLSAAGVELVRALDEAGIAHDASHLADEALDGLLAAARGPVIATHSNCRALAGDDQRHLRDDQIRAIGERRGVIGLNLFSRFLVKEGQATIADCVEHVQHAAEVMGHRRGVGLGSDMDGGFGPGDLPVGLDHPRKLDALAEALRDAGWPDEDVEGFCCANWRHFLERTLPPM
ncbi:MAG: dipeptidase [Planctomycetota bacterium]|jgi:membrane dipeptidase